MLIKNYPLHDMNAVFDMFEATINKGGVDDKTVIEMNFLNKLFASLPAQAVEYGMQFLHGNKDLPAECSEIMPLYIRLVNLAEYLEKVDVLAVIPPNPTTETIMKRKELLDSLDAHEAMFGKPLLGFKADASSAEPVKAEESTESTEEDSGKLHLMNQSASVFACSDITKTAIFYEDKLGFKAVHLDDEKVPHIRLTRDNIVIVLVQSDKAGIVPLRELFGIDYDLYIYASEPFLLQNELKGAGVRMIRELPEAEQAQKSTLNREFVFEDCDGRYICVSQNMNEI